MQIISATCSQSNGAVRILNFAPGSYELYADAAITNPINAPSLACLTKPGFTEDKVFYVAHKYGDCVSLPAAITIEILKETKLFIPSVFTPDNNGVNDKWQIKAQGYVHSYKATVYNRFRQLVFSSIGIHKAWDGKLQGVLVPAGSYIYIISVEDNRNKLIEATDTVTIIY